MMLLYIHGFRTTSASHKAVQLTTHYGDRIVVAEYSFIPDRAVENLEKVIEEEHITGIIASSIGGFYATWLSQKYDLKTVLINPSVRPYESTRRYLGPNERQDGTTFVWKEEHLAMLERYRVERDALKRENFFVFLQSGDDVLDYRVAQAFYEGTKTVLETGGNHRFEGFERHYDAVSAFLGV